MTRTLILLSALALLLAACAPAAVPTVQRDGETVTIRVEANKALYGATVSIVNAETSDERCVQLGGTDLGCSLGDLPAGTQTVVTVVPTADVSCIVFAFTELGAVGSYRPFPCLTN